MGVMLLCVAVNAVNASFIATLSQMEHDAVQFGMNRLNSPISLNNKPCSDILTRYSIFKTRRIKNTPGAPTLFFSRN